jgi:hypothetical protein
MNNNLLTTILANAGYSNSDTLAQIINAVPNPNVALEMLLGVYVPARVGSYFRKGDTLFQVTCRDALRDKICYTEYEQKTKQVFWKTKQDKELGIHQDTRPTGDYHDYGWIKVPGVTERTDRTTDINDFETRWKEISEEEFYSTLEMWDAKPELDSVTL